MGKEQFLGLYITAGVLSSMSSYLHKAVLKQSALSLGAVSFTHAGLTPILLCFVQSECQRGNLRMGVHIIP